MRTLVLLVFCCFVCIPGAYSYVDTTIGNTAPRNVTRNYVTLAHYLCDGLDGDEAKANALYNWITRNIRYDVKSVQKGKLKPAKLDKVLKGRTGVCEGYAKLFTAMCREVGLKAMSIDGYAKDWMFDNGNKVYQPRHMWCAVQINGKWQFTDPTWGAGGMYQAPLWWQKMINRILHRKVSYATRMKFRFKYDSTYFMQNPEAFRLKHLPSDPAWQLTDSAMPIHVFEAGDTAVMVFNEHYSNLKQNDASLARISDLEEDKANLEAAERAYAYNSRYPLALAVKQSSYAAGDVKKILAGSADDSAHALLKNAVVALKASQEHVKAQKKYVPDEYNELKKNNRDKNKVAKQDVLKIKSDDKKLVAQCNQHRKSTDVKYKRVRKNYSTAAGRQAGLDVNKVTKQDPSKIQKKITDPEMRALTDSIATRKNRIAELQLVQAVKQDMISRKQKENELRLDSLGTCLVATDSFLVHETVARLNMKDNYDDEIIKWNGLFSAQKFGRADTLQKYYTAGYDTIIKLYEEYQAAQVVQYDLYKKNLKDVEKYSKWNSNDMVVASTYPVWVKDYSNAIDTGNKAMAAAAAYIKGHKRLFAGLVKVYRRQLQLAEYMDKAETMRKKIEQKTITNRQAFDNNENKKQLAMIKSRIKKLEAIDQ